MTPAGRFAPSPSGELHVGNLRTAILAWLFARSTGRDFLLRVEDLDRARAGAEAEQLRDLAAIGVTWDGAVVRQTDRGAMYDEAIRRLSDAGLTYECFCTRREIQEAPSAPHAPQGAYPGTCRNLDPAELEFKRSMRPAAHQAPRGRHGVHGAGCAARRVHGRGGRFCPAPQRRCDRLQPGGGGGRRRAGRRSGGPRRRSVAFHPSSGISCVTAAYSGSGICARAAGG